MLKGTISNHHRVISISADTWTVQLRFPDEIKAYLQGHNFPPFKMGQTITTMESLTFLPIPQLGQAAAEDLVTYLIVTAENCQMQLYINAQY